MVKMRSASDEGAGKHCGTQRGILSARAFLVYSRRTKGWVGCGVERIQQTIQTF